MVGSSAINGKLQLMLMVLGPTNIAGATAQTYTPVTADDNLYLGCTVSTTDALGTFVTTTTFVGPVDIIEVAPQINTVTLTDLESNANRYTSSVFPYELDMSEAGEPAPTYAVKAKLTGATFNFGVESDTITAVTSTAGTQTYSTDTIANVVSSNNASTFYYYTSSAAGPSNPLTSLTEADYDAAAPFAEGTTATWIGNKNAIVYENTVADPSWGVTFLPGQNSSSPWDTFYESDDFSTWTEITVGSDSLAKTTKRYIGYQSSFTNWLGATSCGVNQNIPATFLTFPTANNFDKFEVGDVVQGSQVVGDYLSGVVPGGNYYGPSYEWDKALNGSVSSINPFVTNNW